MTENQEIVWKAKKTYPIDDENNTQLHYSAASGNLEEVCRDLEKGQRINSENYFGWTALMMATRRGHVDVVKHLLVNNADASKKNKFGEDMSVFLMAVASGKIELINLILQHLLQGGVSKLSMESVLSPLSVAILFKQDAVLRYLLEKSFNINSCTINTGLTPLMFAAALENQKAYHILIQKGANASKKNIQGKVADELFYNRRQQYPKPALSIQVKPTIPAQPVILFSPQPTFFSQEFYPQPIRKSSNVVSPSPNFMFSPNITPMTPLGYWPQQVFFPPNFSPTQATNSMMPPMHFHQYPQTNSSEAFLSPVMAQNVTFSNVSPCLNTKIQGGTEAEYGYAGQNGTS